MSDSAKTKRRTGRNAPTVIIIEHSTLARTTVVKLLERELAGWNVIDLISTESLDRALGAEVRLIVLDLVGRGIESISLRDDLAAIAARFPEAPITLLSGADDVVVARQALKMGIRGLFSTSLAVDIALAGLRLVLAGGTFFPQLLGADTTGSNGHRPARNEAEKRLDDRTQYLAIADFTPREADILAELQSGCSNKVIAGKLNLSGHTVKMHLQHIMRKLQAQNRTEVVARLIQRAAGGQDASPG
ncbi:DNA-binding NarL/FixJ family response regulator [Rhizobium pisi]|uniref:DNA-binding NarL/FixJ family response regulator n=1 Tax=Rhizobium pisi TaxID=574561 RepID=A0A3R9BRU0_9HYPH|nr:response regulator transcription factor [Rhizobium pisi]MBB3135369.1 DNA-binding NarL/FixJ family response regulator [Rhizobium pisi]RSB81438.1 DNA-binding response regulator [Rhizobium pisi]TCA48254.1 response regulator transcription factor [Rhizobium pisi]